MSIFIFAGEKSGDQLGAGLLSSLKKKGSPFIYWGVGGALMKKEDFDIFLPTSQFEVMGFSEVVKKFIKIRKQFYLVLNAILERKPTAVILIDYPGFNLRLAKKLREKGYRGKIVQYVSPTVWAWGKSRIKTLARYYDLLLTLYPFEPSFFANTSLKVLYVGHPLAESIEKHVYNASFKTLFNIPESATLVALFPGSRKSEILKNLTEQLEAAAILKSQNRSLCFGISCAHESIFPIMQEFLKEHSLKINQDIFLLPPTQRYELMKNATVAIAKSGTITLELALHKIPTVVYYKVSYTNRFIAKYILRLKMPFYCIVNILQQKQVFPEFIEKKITPKALALSTMDFLNQQEKQDACKNECEKICAKFFHNTASDKASQAILEVFL
jgi:lipid-A-disaccharide synthase